MKVALLNTQGGYLSVDRPNPFAKPWVKEWEKFEIVPISKIDDNSYKVAIKTRNGDFLSATPSLPRGAAGFQLLEFKGGPGRPGEYEIFTAEIDAIDRVAFKTHIDTYINTRGTRYKWGKGWMCHRKADATRLTQQCKFVITTPEWYAAYGKEGRLHGKNELWKIVGFPFSLTLKVFLSAFGLAALGDYLDQLDLNQDPDAAGGDNDVAGNDADAGNDDPPPDQDAGDGEQAQMIRRGVVAGGVSVVSFFLAGRAADCSNATVQLNLGTLGGGALRQLFATGSVQG